jgi:hypothetical protein
MIKLKPLLLNESGESLTGKTLISVDIQPEYENAFNFNIYHYVEFLNENYDSLHDLVFLYNGADTMDMVSKDEYKMWWYERELNEEVVEGATFYDKGYAFFRFCMDEGIEDEIIANFVRFMADNGVHDSRDMDRDNWAKYIRQYRHTDKRELYDLLKHSDDMINIPDLMDFLQRYRNIELTGGGINECLKEVEIALYALKQPFNTIHKYTY